MGTTTVTAFVHFFWLCGSLGQVLNCVAHSSMACLEDVGIVLRTMSLFLLWYERQHQDCRTDSRYQALMVSVRLVDSRRSDGFHMADNFDLKCIQATWYQYVFSNESNTMLSYMKTTIAHCTVKLYLQYPVSSCRSHHHRAIVCCGCLANQCYAVAAVSWMFAKLLEPDSWVLPG